MTLEEIRQLIELAQETGVAELEVQRSDNRVRVKLAGLNYETTAVPQAGAGLPPRTPSAATPIAQGPIDYANDPTIILVKSPIVGTFYESPSPGAALFTKVGDVVSPGKVICIIESMKLMNEIECEHSGTIVAKLVENGHAVEYGEALFALRPA